jgi:hypothetical protein
MRGMYHVHIVVLVKVIYDNAVDNEEKIKKKNVEHEYKMKFENVKKIENMKVANECDVITLKANNVDDEIARSATFRTLTTESLLRNVLNTQSGGPMAQIMGLKRAGTGLWDRSYWRTIH